MKKLLFIILLFIFIGNIFGQGIATTNNGLRVNLYSDFTWNLRTLEPFPCEDYLEYSKNEKGKDKICSYDFLILSKYLNDVDLVFFVLFSDGEYFSISSGLFLMPKDIIFHVKSGDEIKFYFNDGTVLICDHHGDNNNIGFYEIYFDTEGYKKNIYLLPFKNHLLEKIEMTINDKPFFKYVRKEEAEVVRGIFRCLLE